MASPSKGTGEKKRVSVVCTLKNEAGSLDVLMSSLLNQTLKPQEIVVVDGGSTDGTWERLQDWKGILAKVKIKLVLVQKKGNIAHGRNTAIKKAGGEWIASIDGGCAAESDWLEKLAGKDGDVVAGNFRPAASGLSEKIQAVFVHRSTARNPSSRSVMFRKSCWKKAGGYPEHLYTGEDTLFNSRLEGAGCKFAVADDALVNWRMRPGLGKWLKQFFLYGKGDGEAGLNPGTSYGKKVAFLVVGGYFAFAASLIYPPTIMWIVIASMAYGLSRSLSIHGVIGGFFLPLRFLAYLAGLHAGIAGRIAKGDLNAGSGHGRNK